MIEYKSIILTPPKFWFPIHIKNKAKKKLLDKICDIYNKINTFALTKIIVTGNRVNIIPDILNVSIGPKLNETIMMTPYEFSNKHQHHVFANHANIKLGGGIFNSGFAQEEQLLLKTTLMFSIGEITSSKTDNILNINLEKNSLLAKCNLYVHQNPNLNLYGNDGMQKIKNNPDILNFFYSSHYSKPEIFILSKAIPILNRENTYRTYKYANIQMVEWIFFSAYCSYLSTIQTLNNYHDIHEIVIHDGNWGCGVYGHNVNVIYVILHLAFRIAARHSNKKVSFIYHTYNISTYNKLSEGIQLLLQVKQNNTVLDILNQIKILHNNNHPLWSKKI